jgi:hypothetical protein
MVVKWFVLSLLLMGLGFLLYFQHFTANKLKPYQSVEQELIDMFSSEPVVDNRGYPDNNPFKSSDTGNTGYQLNPAPSAGKFRNSSAISRRIEIFGRVIDEYAQPVESVLVSEDRYLYSTRSDSNGQYRLTIELPKHKIPMLHFLRTGYEGDRLGISAEDLGNNSKVELNVTLIESSESVKIDGWISNEYGESLPQQKIRISSWGYQGQESIYQTAVSDEKGGFVFEAVKPDINYELEVYPSPDYAPYSIEELNLTRTTPLLIITLKTLKFIQVSGMFIDVEGAPVPNFEIDLINISTGSHVRRIASDSSGFFSLENFPAGEVRFSSRPPEHFKITGLTLAENEYKHLVLVVDKGAYQISGWVSDQNGIAVSRAMVMLDSELLNEGIRSVSNRATITDRTGRFQFDQLTDTPHQITIYAKGFDKKELLHRFQSPASEIHIALSRQ